MELKPKKDEPISLDKLQELFKHLEETGYFGKIEITFQGKPVRVHLYQPMKNKELERFLVRERPAKYHAGSVS